LEEMIERFVPEGGKVKPYKPPKKEKSGGDSAASEEAEPAEAS
jgi:hypothetical protein